MQECFFLLDAPLKSHLLHHDLVLRPCLTQALHHHCGNARHVVYFGQATGRLPTRTHRPTASALSLTHYLRHHLPVPANTLRTRHSSIGVHQGSEGGSLLRPQSRSPPPLVSGRLDLVVFILPCSSVEHQPHPAADHMPEVLGQPQEVRPDPCQ